MALLGCGAAIILSSATPAAADEVPAGASLTVIEASRYGDSRVVVFQAIVNNTVFDVDSRRTVSIVNSGNNHSGIFQLNMDAGSASNQANVHALALVGLEGVSAIGASVHVSRVRSGNFLYASNNHRSVNIVGSFNNSSGLFGVNINTGNLNNQVNAFALTFGRGSAKSVVTMADSSLGDVKADASKATIEGEQKRDVTIKDSFKNFTGVLQLNIATGDGNNMSISTTANISVRTLQ